MSDYRAAEKLPQCITITKKNKQTPLTRQTGQVLLTFGILFKHVPPFNETVDENTGETLISIGRKLLFK